MPLDRTSKLIAIIDDDDDHARRLEVSKRERLERQIVIDPIPTLFVCALPHGPLEVGCGSWPKERPFLMTSY
jgi:hypothetical protein